MNHKSHTRWLAIVLSVLLGISGLHAAGWDDADEDDLYYSPAQAAKAEKKRAEERAEAARQARIELEARYARQDSATAAYNAAHPVQSLQMSEDAYNRRLSSAPSLADSVTRSQLEMGDTYGMTRRLERFHNENVVTDTQDEELIAEYYSLGSDDVTVYNVYLNPMQVRYVYPYTVRPYYSNPYCYGAYNYPWYNPYYYDPVPFCMTWGPYINYNYWWGWAPNWGDWSLGWGPVWRPGWVEPGYGHNHYTVRPGGISGGGGRPVSTPGNRPNIYRPGGSVTPAGTTRPGHVSKPNSNLSAQRPGDATVRPGTSVNSRPGNTRSGRVNNARPSNRTNSSVNTSTSSRNTYHPNNNGSSTRPGGYNNNAGSGSSRSAGASHSVGSGSSGRSFSGGHSVSGGGGRGRR